MSREVLEMTMSQIEAKGKFLKLVDSGQVKLAEFQCCPSCRNPEFKVLVKEDRHGISCEARLCTSCGLVFSSPHVALESIEYFYNHIYGRLNYKTSTPKHLFSQVQGDNIFNFISEFSKDIKSIVDIGAGSGDVVKVFSAKLENAQVIGIDYNEELVNRFKATRNSKMVVGGVEELEHGEQKFDLIILSHVLEHIVDLQGFFKKIKTLLNQNSLIYIEVPGIFGYFRDSHYYEHSFEIFHTIAHVYNFTLMTLQRVLEENGFEIIKGDEKIRILVRVSQKKSIESFEYLRVSNFLEKTLPHVRNNYFNSMKPYLSHEIARYDYPLKEVELSKVILKLKEFDNLNKEVIRLREIEKEYNCIKNNPITFIFRKLRKKMLK
jgi:ubiquinone/menaquinone biosynthesis C-methylase UbiE